jgi:hypothetical protein
MAEQSFFKSRPFLIILALAVGLRLIAVIYSQGFMAHDDHFETVEIANSWQHEGMYLPDGTLRWEGKPEIGVMRSAVYNLFLLGLMNITSTFGIEKLATHMYFERLVHALLSLLPVIFGYRYLKEETNDRVAVAGGILLAAHFLMPYLAVRNLVEMVAADFLFPCLYFATSSMKRQSDSEAVLAGVLGGVAFMVRMQVIMALAVIPIAMVIRRRVWRQAIVFSLAVGWMIFMQGMIDTQTHGKFLGSVTNYVVGNMSAPPTLPGPWYRYILLILGVMIPPFSLVFIGSMFQPKLIRNHLVLWLPLMAFVVGHSVITNKQERFIIPVFPLIIVLGCVGLYYLLRSNGWYFRWRKLRAGLWIWLAVLNLILLIPFTVNYGHRGSVDPLVYLSDQPDAKKVLFDCSERKMFVPYSYWQYDRSDAVTVFSRVDIYLFLADGKLLSFAPPDYIVVFTDDKLREHEELLTSLLGRYTLVYHGRPSLIDAALHTLNPKYNFRNESWVLRKVKS